MRALLCLPPASFAENGRLEDEINSCWGKQAEAAAAGSIPSFPLSIPVDETLQQGNISHLEASPSPHFCPDGGKAKILGKSSPAAGFPAASPTQSHAGPGQLLAAGHRRPRNSGTALFSGAMIPAPPRAFKPRGASCSSLCCWGSPCGWGLRGLGHAEPPPAVETQPAGSCRRGNNGEKNRRKNAV